MKQKISKKDTFAEAMKKDPEMATIFQDAGMHCCGCPYAQFESIEQGAAVHGIDVDSLVKKINSKKKAVKRR